MAKILTDKDMLSIVTGAIIGREIDDRDQYYQFLEDLGVVIADHFGGRSSVASQEDAEYFVAFHITEEVPSDGGVYARYDKDVTWKDGKEVEV